MTDDTRQLLANLRDEQNGAVLYDALAAAEKDPRLAEIYRRFAHTERRHAQAWTERLAAAGMAVPPFRPAFRTRVLAALARRFGVGMVLPTIRGMEQAGAGSYARQGAAGLAGDEASHARVLRQIRGGLAGDKVAQLEGRHRAGGGNALRAAVLGANDGLVSNFSLVMGVAGALAESQGGAVLVTGLAGLLAGACSMALGEWLSVQSSRELFLRQIEIERSEIAANPEEEAEELALIYQARGVPAEEARQLATKILSDPAAGLETLAREELGVDPKELGGSAWEAAITSFLLFTAGAALPVIPFLFLHGLTAVVVSAGVSVAGLFTIGMCTSLFTGRPAACSGLRMVAFGLAAAAITFGLGKFIGCSLAG